MMGSDVYAPPRATQGEPDDTPRRWPLWSAVLAYIRALPLLVAGFLVVDALPAVLSRVIIPELVSANTSLFNILCIGLEAVLFPAVILLAVGMTGPLGVRASLRRWRAAAALYAPVAVSLYGLVLVGNLYLKESAWLLLIFSLSPAVVLLPAMLLDAPAALEETGPLLRRSPLRIVAVGILMSVPVGVMMVLKLLYMLFSPNEGWLPYLTWYAGSDVLFCGLFFWYVGASRLVSR